MFRVHRCRRPHVGHRKARASRALRATNDMRAPAQAGWCAVLPRNRRGGVQTAGALRAHQAETWTTCHARKRRTNENAARRRRFSIAERITVRRPRSEEHTSELQSLMRISYAVFCLKKKNKITDSNTTNNYAHTSRSSC